MRKGLLSLLAIIFAFTTVHAATLLHEPFSQSTGDVLTTAVFDANNTSAWMYTKGFSGDLVPNTIKVTDGNMTMTNNGYMASGTTASNRLTLGTSSSTRYAFHNFTSQKSGSVFLAAIVNVAELRDYTGTQTDDLAERSGGYLFCLGNGTAATQQTARVYTRTAMENGKAVGFYLGVGKLNESVGKPNDDNYQWADGNVLFDKDHVYQAGVDYLIVVEYKFVSGKDNDKINLYVNPSKSRQEATIKEFTNTKKGDIANISLVGILEGSAQQTKVFIDELKVATDWASLFPGEETDPDPYIDVTPATVNLTDGIMEVGQTYSTTITLKGGYLKDNTVTLVNDRPDELTLSKETFTKAEIESGAQVTITAKPNKIALGKTMRLTISCGELEKVLKISWNANKLIECPTVAALNEALALGTGEQMLNVKFTGEALVTYSFHYGRYPSFYNFAIIQDATAACAIRCDSVYFDGTTDQMAVGNKVTGMQLTDGTSCLMTTDSIAQPDFKVKSTGNPVVPTVISASEMAQHHFELVTIKGTTFQPAQGVTTFDVSLQNVKNDSHGWGKCAKVDATASGTSFVTSITNSVGADGKTPICNLANQTIPTKAVNATGLVWGDAELRLRDKSDLAEVVMATVTVSCDPTMGSVTGGGTFQEGSTVTLTASPKDHFRFVKWSDGDKNATRQITVNGNVELTAQFEAIMFTVTVGCNSTQGTVTGGGTFQEGSTVTLTATPKNHFRFVQWSDGVKTATRQVTVNSDITLTATFEAINFTVTVNCNADQGSVTGGGTFQEGSTVTLTATPKNHFRFVQWSDGVKTATREVTVNSDITLTAEFEAINFTVTVNCNAEQGSVTGGGTFQEGSTVTLTATPKNHFRFVQWSDGVKTATRQVTVNSDITLTATFEAINFTVTVNCNAEQGSVTGGGTFQEGNTVTISATPKDHFRFVQWSDGEKNATRQITVNSNVEFTALFEAIEFTVTVSCNAEQGSVTGGGKFQEGSTVTISATPKDHFRFVQWSDGEKNATRQITVNSNVEFTALFEAIEFTVTVSCNAEQGSVTGGGTFQEGSTVTISATPKDHFRFVKWNDGVTTATRQITVNDNVEFTAEFEAIEFMVTVSCNSTQGTVTGGGTFQEGSTVTLTASPKDHFRFVGWSDGDKNATRQITVNGNVELTAQFEAIMFTVTVGCNSTQGTVTGGGTFQEGSTVTLTASPKDHFRFVQWSDGDKNATRQITVNSNVEFTALFEAIEFTVTVSCNAEQGSVTGGGKFQEGSTVTISATPKDHFRFVQWSDGEKTATRQITVNSNVELTAQFEAIMFTVTVGCNSTQGTVTGGGKFQEGSTVTISATPKDHFRFVQWSDGEKTATRQITVNSNVEFTALFEAIEFTVTVSCNAEQGSVTGGGKFQEGSTVTISATPKAHFRFVRWSDGVETATRQITVNGNVELTALFEAIEFTVTVSCNPEQGTVTGGGTFQEGSTATISATPKAHFRFVRWSDGVTTATRDITVVEDVEFIAEFEAIEFTVTVSCNAEQGTVTGGGTFQEGTVIELTASAIGGFSFFQWSDGNTENPRTVTVEGDLFLTAIFVQDKPTTLDQTTSVVSVKKVMYDGHVLIIRNDDVYDLTGRKQ